MKKLYQGIIRFVTEHRRAKEAFRENEGQFRESERRLSEMLENIPFIAIMLDLYPIETIEV